MLARHIFCLPRFNLRDESKCNLKRPSLLNDQNSVSDQILSRGRACLPRESNSGRLGLNGTVREAAAATRTDKFVSLSSSGNFYRCEQRCRSEHRSTQDGRDTECNCLEKCNRLTRCIMLLWQWRQTGQPCRRMITAHPHRAAPVQYNNTILLCIVKIRPLALHESLRSAVIGSSPVIDSIITSCSTKINWL